VLFKFVRDRLSEDVIYVNVHNVESIRWDRQGSIGYVTMTSGARHTIYESDYDKLEAVLSRIPATP